MPMDIDKILMMLKTLNLVTETMSLHSNVEIDDKALKIRFLRRMNAYNNEETKLPYVEFVIYKLNDDKKERITDFNQILDYVDVYNESIIGLHEAMMALQSLEHHRFQSDYAEEARRNMKDKFKRCINLCQYYKSKTIEIHNKLKAQRDNVIEITYKKKNPHK